MSESKTKAKTQAAAAAAPPADAAAPAQPQMPQRGVMVWFKFVSKEGNSGDTRTFFTGPPDLRTQGDIAAVEKLILENNPGLTGAFVTNWKPLEA